MFSNLAFCTVTYLISQLCSRCCLKPTAWCKGGNLETGKGNCCLSWRGSLPLDVMLLSWHDFMFQSLCHWLMTCNCKTSTDSEDKARPVCELSSFLCQFLRTFIVLYIYIYKGRFMDIWFCCYWWPVIAKGCIDVDKITGDWTLVLVTYTM